MTPIKPPPPHRIIGPKTVVSGYWIHPSEKAEQNIGKFIRQTRRLISNREGEDIVSRINELTFPIFNKPLSEFLRSLEQFNEQQISVQDIVCRFFGVKEDELFNKLKVGRTNIKELLEEVNTQIYTMYRHSSLNSEEFSLPSQSQTYFDVYRRNVSNLMQQVQILDPQSIQTPTRESSTKYSINLTQFDFLDQEKILKEHPFNISDTKVSGKVHLTLSEYRLLACLYSEPGKIFTFDELYRVLYPDISTTYKERYNKMLYLDTLRQHISSLRKKITKASKINPQSSKLTIENIRSLGYKLIII